MIPDWTKYGGFAIAPCLPCCAEPCPPPGKMLIPALTEATHIWYANLAAATAVLADAKQVSSCIGFCSSSPKIAVLQASDGPFMLTGYGDGDGPSYPKMWGSINLVAGSVTSIAYDLISAAIGTSLTGTVVGKIYDDTGTLLDTQTASGEAGLAHLTGTMTFAPVPTTGRYIIYVEASCTLGVPYPAIFTITSDKATTTNTIVALYDTGAASPSCLAC